jgi:hypothetical protein
MSAFIVGRPHITALVNLALHGPRDGERTSLYTKMGNPDQMGQALWDENYRSFNYRYEDHQTAPPYRHPLVTREDSVPSAIEGLKVIACYEYQACEHPGWQTSTAKAFCEELRAHLIYELPGYSNAPWEWPGADASTEGSA